MPQYSLGVVPILDINDNVNYTIPTSVQFKEGQDAVHVEVDETVQVDVPGKTATEPVYTQAVT